VQKKFSAAQTNAAFMTMLREQGDGHCKRASDASTDYTRVQIRESSVFEQLMPSEPCADNELTPQLSSDKNVRLVNREPNSPGAVTVPLGQQPIMYNFRGDRYPVYFDRMMTRKYTKDMSELRTYGIDLRQILTDNAILDMEFEYDRKMLSAMQSIVGVEGSVVPETGIVQNLKIVDASGVSRRGLKELNKILPRSFAKLSAAVIVVNHITVHDVTAFGRDEVGGDLSEAMFTEGFTAKRMFGVTWIVTNKHELIDENEFWMTASPDFLGKSYVLEDTTLYIKKEAMNLEFYAYCERGATIGNPAAVAKGRIAIV